MQLSPNFSLARLIYSPTARSRGIDNMPGRAEIANLKLLCTHILEPLLRAKGAFNVSSGYRSKTLNRWVGGSPVSQHCKGQAADITSTNKAALYHYIYHYLDFDQLIWEFGNSQQPQWIHVSYNPKAYKNRREVLKATKVNGKIKYTRLPYKPLNKTEKAKKTLLYKLLDFTLAAIGVGTATALAYAYYQKQQKKPKKNENEKSTSVLPIHPISFWRT